MNKDQGRRKRRTGFPEFKDDNILFPSAYICERCKNLYPDDEMRQTTTGYRCIIRRRCIDNNTFLKVIKN